MGSDRVWIILTLVPVGLLFHAYVLYPALLWALSKLRRGDSPRPGEPPNWPRVSVLVSAYNEAPVIADRIENLLALDYPRDRLELLVGSDGSADPTCDIVRSYQDRGVGLLAFTQRRGKASVVNDLVARADGEIVVLTDANAFFRPDAVRQLVTALWRYPSACAVVGVLDLRAAGPNRTPEGAYWRYETWLKTLESRFGSVLGANGAIYAFHRQRYQPLPAATIVDDFLIPMLMQLKTGGKVYLIPDAQAYETAPEKLKSEFRRRVRIGAGDYQALFWTWRLLLPTRGIVAFAYLSHKLLRWLGPWFLLLMFAANLWLLGRPLFQGLLAAQLAFYLLGMFSGLVRPIPVLGRIAIAVQHFITLNAALLLGSLRFAFGLQRPFWTTARS